MVGDAPDDVGEIGLGVKAVALGTLDDGVEDSGAGFAGIGARKGPVSPSEG